MLFLAPDSPWRQRQQQQKAMAASAENDTASTLENAGEEAEGKKVENENEEAANSKEDGEEEGGGRIPRICLIDHHVTVVQGSEDRKRYLEYVEKIIRDSRPGVHGKFSVGNAVEEFFRIHREESLTEEEKTIIDQSFLGMCRRLLEPSTSAADGEREAAEEKNLGREVIEKASEIVHRSYEQAGILSDVKSTELLNCRFFFLDVLDTIRGQLQSETE